MKRNLKKDLILLSTLLSLSSNALAYGEFRAIKTSDYNKINSATLFENTLYRSRNLPSQDKYCFRNSNGTLVSYTEKALIKTNLGDFYGDIMRVDDSNYDYNSGLLVNGVMEYTNLNGTTFANFYEKKSDFDSSFKKRYNFEDNETEEYFSRSFNFPAKHFKYKKLDYSNSEYPDFDFYTNLEDLALISLFGEDKIRLKECDF